ncbi:hypothetical protein ACFVZJ_31395 [Streptomyces sp. NPDC058322]|uniref:hypothetical protein n=1 Tax=unclassified Streptomyces TaxID=2593676 RepID=UPI0036E5E700
MTGLLEERERAARQRVEALQAELREAEAVWERFVIARETVGEVLAEPRAGEEVRPAVVAGERPVQVTAAVPGSVVPRWQEGLAPMVLAPDYRRTMDVLAGGSGTRGKAMHCRQLAAAVGPEPVPATVEGVRTKAKRPAARGRLAEERPGMSSVPSHESAAHDQAHRPPDHRL